MSLTNFPNGISSFGVPVMGSGVPVAPAGVGKVYYVDQQRGNDALSGLSPDNALLTLSAAHTKMTANQDDVALVFGSCSSIAVRETTTLTWSKNKCHIIGMNAVNPIAQRVSLRAASGSTFTPLMNLTADGCLIQNMHLYHGYDDDSAQICLQITGERNALVNLHIGGGGHATAGAHAGMRCIKIAPSGGEGENWFKNCVIGLDTVSYDAANAHVEITGGSPRNIFDDCVFTAFTGSSGAGREFLLIGSGGIDRFLLMRRCIFSNSIHSTATAMTQALSVHASAGGHVMLLDCWQVGCTDWETSASGAVLVNMPVADTADAGFLIDYAPA